MANTGYTRYYGWNIGLRNRKFYWRNARHSTRLVLQNNLRKKSIYYENNY
jgi:hypothetical protein